MSTLVMIPLGAIMLEGSLSDLWVTDDAWFGGATAPWITGFVLVGTAISTQFDSSVARWVWGLGPLLLFAGLLVLLDSVADLGEGEQIVGYYGIGLFLAALLSTPAFIVRRRSLRIMLMIVPPLIIAVGFISVLEASG